MLLCWYELARSDVSCDPRCNLAQSRAISRNLGVSWADLRVISLDVGISGVAVSAAMSAVTPDAISRNLARSHAISGSG